MGQLTRQEVEIIGAGMDSWDQVDCFATLATRDAKSVNRFIRQYRARLAARVLREVTAKLRTGLKTPKRNWKIAS
jgi:hypothetical protein